MAATLSRENMREYMREYRAKRAAGEIPAPEVTDGVAANLLEELTEIPGVSKQLTLAATALRLAQVLDDPKSTPQKPSAARQLREIMATLKSAEASTRGKLQNLRQNRATGQ